MRSVHCSFSCFVICGAIPRILGIGEIQSPTASKIANNGLQWVWSPPIELNGETLEGYLIRYAPVGSDDFMEQTVPLPVGNSQNVVGDITELDPVTEYRFQILAVSNFGRGAIVERTETSPGKL